MWLCILLGHTHEQPVAQGKAGNTNAFTHTTIVTGPAQLTRFQRSEFSLSEQGASKMKMVWFLAFVNESTHAKHEHDADAQIVHGLMVCVGLGRCARGNAEAEYPEVALRVQVGALEANSSGAG